MRDDSNFQNRYFRFFDACIFSRKEWKIGEMKRKKVDIQKYRNLCEQFNFPLDKPRERSHLCVLPSFHFIQWEIKLLII